MFKNKKGFSLAEIVVATGILSMIIVAFAGIMNSSYKVFNYSNGELQALSRATAIMRDFEKTTRGASAFETNTATTLTYFAYQRGDLYPAASKISYYFEGDTLKKSVIAPVAGANNTYIYPEENKKVSTFVGQITNHNIFSYADEMGNFLPTIAPAAIRMIKVEVRVEGKVPATETTLVQLRNLKTNL